jgi:PPM family protein phosphatase
VVELVQEANRRVHQRALDDVSASGMGTTMTVALFAEDGSVTIGHVGDSRAYILRDGHLEQLTDDHSLVAELVRRGELSQAEAEVHPQRSVITRALGTDPSVEVDAFTVPARPGDVFLLCSDGLTTMVDASGIAELVLKHRDDLPQATRALIDAANDRGGDDNVTAVLFEVAEAGAAAAAATAEVAADPDEADTLHPEDGVVLPPLADEPEDEPAPVDEPRDEPTDEPTTAEEPRAAGDTVIVSAAELSAAAAGVASTPSAGSEVAGVPPAPMWRKLLALLVIVVLAGAIVLLVTRGLAR